MLPLRDAIWKAVFKRPHATQDRTFLWHPLIKSEYAFQMSQNILSYAFQIKQREAWTVIARSDIYLYQELEWIFWEVHSPPSLNHFVSIISTIVHSCSSTSYHHNSCHFNIFISLFLPHSICSAFFHSSIEYKSPWFLTHPFSWFCQRK